MQLFLAFFVALSITALLIPLLERVAPRIGLTDEPNPRKVHSTPVPRIGGIAMAAGILAALLVGTDFGPRLQGLALGVSVLLAFGIWDDRRELDYRTKLLGQLVAVTLCLAFSDVRIATLTLAGRHALPVDLSTLLTGAFLLGVTNAVNLSDGLDGLAGGMALLCCCGIALLALSSGDLPVVAVALVVAGATLGFLRFNTHPARVFMGDSGSQVLGFTVGVLAILATQGEATAVSAALPLLLIGMPIMDTLAVMWIRLREGRSPFRADRNHVHHRLLAFGFRHGEAVVLVYLLQGALFLLAYFMRFESDLLIVATFLGFATLVLGLLRFAARSGWRARDGAHRTRLALAADQLRARIGRSGIPALAGVLATLAVMAYAARVVLAAPRIGTDIAWLAGGLLGVLALAAVLRRARGDLPLLDRALAYTAVVLIVYLDQLRGDTGSAGNLLTWALLGTAALAAVGRLTFSPQQRFGASSLDLLVLFVAVVVPQLPGPLQSAPLFTGGVAKAVVLLYVTEMVLALERRRALPAVLLASLLVLMLLRAVS